MKALIAAPPRLVVTFLVIKVLVALANLWWFPVLGSRPQGSRTQRSRTQRSRMQRSRTPDAAPAGPDTPAEGITLLLPMRNEADRLPSTLPRLFASGASTLIFLDDESTDGSAELVAQAAAALPASGGATTVTVIRGRAKPDGWVGKTWACAQLADAFLNAGDGQSAVTDLLVFCDVDVELAPGALNAVVAEMDRQRADVFSVFPGQRTGTWGERLLTPLIDDVLLCFLPFGLLSSQAGATRSAATACGALLAFRRGAYEQLGGFAAVRGELVEDVAMARLSRRRGLRLGLVLGGGEVRVRMYDGYHAVIHGLGRGLTATAGGRRWLVVAGYLWHVLAYTVPVAMLGRSWWWRSAAALAIAERMLVEEKTGGRDWLAAVAVSASPVAALPVVLRAVRREQQWRGRIYR